MTLASPRYAGLCNTGVAPRTMRRRELIGIAGTTLFAWPLMARAQQQAKIARVGVLGFGARPPATRIEALRAGLRDLGYVESKNLVIEFHWPGTAELARMKVDIILATSSAEVDSARRATHTIPIVFVTHADPVGLGHVSSLARPGGNLTGLAAVDPDIIPKRMEVLKETVPRATRFGVLWATTSPSHRPVLQATEAAREKVDVQLLTVGVSHGLGLRRGFREDGARSRRRRSRPRVRAHRS